MKSKILFFCGFLTLWVALCALVFFGLPAKPCITRATIDTETVQSLLTGRDGLAEWTALLSSFAIAWSPILIGVILVLVEQWSGQRQARPSLACP